MEPVSRCEDMKAQSRPHLKTGVLGGMSDKATAEYYGLLNEGVKAKLGGWNTAEMIISSVNFANIERFLRTDDWSWRANTWPSKQRGSSVPAQTLWYAYPIRCTEWQIASWRD